MDYFELNQEGGDAVLRGVRHFSLEEILDCGQCFRWQRERGDGVTYRGIALGRLCRITQEGETLRFHSCGVEEVERLWLGYFDLERDYGALKARFEQDPVMKQAVAFCPGMRVLRQEPWEALCSFILSQNNNIKRIRGLVDRLCELLGEPVEGGRAFPTPTALAACEKEDLEPVRCGFRAGYLLDAARKVAGGEIALEALYTLPIGEARQQLQTIKGVGPKVAECALLYGWGRMECFPVDVWIARALEQHYPQGFPRELEPWAGIAQQYLFHFMRCAPSERSLQEQQV